MSSSPAEVTYRLTETLSQEGVGAGYVTLKEVVPGFNPGYHQKGENKGVRPGGHPCELMLF